MEGGNLAAVAVAGWREAGSRPVLQDIDGTWLAAGDLLERTSGIARRLRAAGLAPRDRVILCAGTSAALVCAYIGLLRAGLVAVPVNPAYTRREVERLVRASGPAAAIVEGDEVARWVAAAAPEDVRVTGLELRGLPRPRASESQASDSPASDSPASDAGLDLAAAGDPALLLYTSGTTGTPKGALLSHGNLLAGARGVTLAWRWTTEDRLLLTLPLFHMHGLGVGVNGSLVAGGQLVLRPTFDAADVADHCRRSEISMFFGVPAMYQRLLSAGQATALTPLRLIVSGSAPLSPAQSDELTATAGQRPLERYGMTETVMLTSNLLEGPRKAGKVGLPLPGVQLRLGPGGAVQVRGPNVLAGYDRHENGDDVDAGAFTADGWFETGDLGELDTDGHLRLVGRSKELIISGGFNVHPREVEEVISQFPGVREAAVVGRPSREWGEAVTAVVVADGPVDPSAVRAFAAERLAAYKVPKGFEFVEELPRNALGKVLRHDL